MILHACNILTSQSKTMTVSQHAITTSQEHATTCLILLTMVLDQVVRWCKDKEIGLVLVGPEAPLVSGLIDALKAGGIR